MTRLMKYWTSSPLSGKAEWRFTHLATSGPYWAKMSSQAR